MYSYKLFIFVCYWHIRSNLNLRYLRESESVVNLLFLRVAHRLKAFLKEKVKHEQLQQNGLLSCPWSLLQPNHERNLGITKRQSKSTSSLCSFSLACQLWNQFLWYGDIFLVRKVWRQWYSLATVMEHPAVLESLQVTLDSQHPPSTEGV